MYRINEFHICCCWNRQNTEVQPDCEMGQRNAAWCTQQNILTYCTSETLMLNPFYHKRAGQTDNLQKVFMIHCLFHI